MALHTHASLVVGRLFAFGLLAQVLTAAAAPAQTLADVARQEEARRKDAPSGKAYSNGDLKVEPPPSVPLPVAAPAPVQTVTAAEPAPDAAKPEPDAVTKDGVKKDETWWRQRIKGERDALDRARTFSDALQSRINALTGDFARRDDPAQRNLIVADRQKASTELDRVKKEIEQHTKIIAEIQEEGRRAGVAAGWLR